MAPFLTSAPRGFSCMAPVASTLVGVGVILAAAQAIAVQDRPAAPGPQAQPPNILLIVADDLGFNQVGANGDTPIKTPNLDRLAANGIRFTQAYCGGPVCSPSRVSLLTGRDARLMSDVSNQVRLEASDVTIPRVLKEGAYDTALFGKYSIGDQMGVTDPLAIGFDTWYGMFLINEGHRQYPTFLWRDGQIERLPENEGRRRGAYAQERFTDEALRYLRQDRERPFFALVAFSSPHAELAVPETYSKPYEGVYEAKPYAGMKGRFSGGQDRYSRYYPEPVENPQATLAGMVTALDDYVGRLMDALLERGVAENTLVFFTSDNGPHEEGGADPSGTRAAAPYRGIKRDLYEGGIHVPMICHWPARITEPRADETPWAFADMLPTLAEVAGVDLALVPQLRSNGVSIAGRLRDDPQPLAERTLSWRYTEQIGDPNSGVLGTTKHAARRGKWKAVRVGDQAPIELFDLEADPGETRDLGDTHTARRDEFQTLFNSHAAKR